MAGTVIKEIDWNGHHYTFTNTFHSTGTKSHDVLTMEDENGHSWVGETTWINRPWHRFDLEEAFSEIVGKAFGSKALDLIYEINKNAWSVTDAIEKFFAQFNPADITASTEVSIDGSDEARRAALAKYLEVDVEDVELIDDNHEFLVDGNTYIVLTDDEAEEQFEEEVRRYWEDAGIEGLESWLQDWIFENALDEEALSDVVRDEIEQEVWNLSDEETADRAIEAGLRESDDLYDEESDAWAPELRDDVDFDDLRSELIDEEFDLAVDDGCAEYLRNMGFSEDFFLDYIDEDAVLGAIKDAFEVNGEGRGIIAWYDGAEHDLDNGLFAYRID